jgi:hypothetical protein
MTSDNLPATRPTNFAEAVALIRENWLSLANAAGVSVETLVDVMQNGRNDLARVNAATAVLDRVGLPTRVDVAVRLATPVDTGDDDSGPHNDGAIAALRDRLTQIAARPHEPAPPVDTNVVDGEIVEEEGG